MNIAILFRYLGSLWQFKRDEQNINNGNIPVGVNSTNSTSFKCKSCFFRALAAADNGLFKNAKIAVPLNIWVIFGDV